MTPRDEEQVLCKQLDLVLNGETVTIDVRSIRANRVLRRRVGVMLSATQAGDDVVAAVLIDGADALMDLPALYAPEIKEQCETASDEELVTAGVTILEVVYPFVQATIVGLTGFTSRLEAGQKK